MAPRAQGADPRNAQLFRYHPSVCGTRLGIAVLIYWWDVLGLRFLTVPAVTSASEVLTQTYVARFQWSLLRYSVFSVRKCASFLPIWFVQECCSQQEQENIDSPPGSRQLGVSFTSQDDSESHGPRGVGFYSSHLVSLSHFVDSTV